jgi:hypothetical protein
VQFVVKTFDHRTNPVTVSELGPFPTIRAAETALEQDGWQLHRASRIPTVRVWGKPYQAALLRIIHPKPEETP